MKLEGIIIRLNFEINGGYVIQIFSLLNPFASFVQYNLIPYLEKQKQNKKHANGDELCVMRLVRYI